MVTNWEYNYWIDYTNTTTIYLGNPKSLYCLFYFAILYRWKLANESSSLDASWHFFWYILFVFLIGSRGTKFYRRNVESIPFVVPNSNFCWNTWYRRGKNQYPVFNERSVLGTLLVYESYAKQAEQFTVIFCLYVFYFMLNICCFWCIYRIYTLPNNIQFLENNFILFF